MKEKEKKIVDLMAAPRGRKWRPSAALLAAALAVLSSGAAYAQMELFWNASGGVSLMSSETAFGGSYKTSTEPIDDGTDGTIYGDYTWGNGIGGMAGVHIGLSSGSLSLETGVDCIFLNNVTTALKWDPTYSKTEYVITDTTLDIPFLVGIGLPINQRLALKPMGGLYLSIPIISSNDYDDDFNMTSPLIFGIQGGLRMEMSFANGGALIFGANYKKDFSVINADAKVTSSSTYTTWFNITRQAAQLFAGYQGLFKKPAL